jgi:hypothetical protein
VDGGIIQGYFPALLIQGGDRFTAQVGCQENEPDCDVTFELKYRVIVPPSDVVAENSFVFHEVFDGTITPIDLNLGSLGLTGSYVSFIFRVKANNNSNENEAIWVAPRIVR